MVFGASERGSRSLAVFWQNLRSDSSQLVYKIELKEFMECLGRKAENTKYQQDISNFYIK